jgi:hypothetical protein
MAVIFIADMDFFYNLLKRDRSGQAEEWPKNCFITIPPPLIYFHPEKY